MRLSNKRNKSLYIFAYTFVGILFLLGCIAYILEFNKFNVFGNKAWMIMVVPIILFLILFSFGKPLFDYDSDGEALNFRNFHVLPLFKKNHKDEFPKYKLLKYNIVSILLYRNLYIYISSKKNHITILKYNISFLSRKQVRDLKFSLTKVINANREMNRGNKNGAI